MSSGPYIVLCAGTKGKKKGRTNATGKRQTMVDDYPTSSSTSTPPKNVARSNGGGDDGGDDDGNGGRGGWKVTKKEREVF